MDKKTLILASTSSIRARLLVSAGLNPIVVAPRVDETTLTQSMLADAASPRDIADALAEAKARKVSSQHPGAFVLGCDQTLDIGGQLLGKPTSPGDAFHQLNLLQGKTHHLYAAAVLYENGRPIWRHIGQARMTMRALPNASLQTYVAANWPSIGQSVGCYKIEEMGAQLFSAIEGDTFSIQGLPLIALLNQLAVLGVTEI